MEYLGLCVNRVILAGANFALPKYQYAKKICYDYFGPDVFAKFYDEESNTWVSCPLSNYPTGKYHIRIDTMASQYHLLFCGAKEDIRRTIHHIMDTEHSLPQYKRDNFQILDTNGIPITLDLIILDNYYHASKAVTKPITSLREILITLGHHDSHKVIFLRGRLLRREEKVVDELHLKDLYRDLETE